MIFLSVDGAELARRLAARHGHFFPAQLLATQLGVLELPGPSETTVTVVSARADPADTVAAIIAIVRPGEGAEGGHHEADA